MGDEDWYYCLKHKRVEQGAGCANTDRLGPYASQRDAENALARSAERNDEWERDPRWRDD